jgi:hypothetical protein
MEFMRFLSKGLSPFKIQTRFKVGFTSEFYISKSRAILKKGQKRKFVLFEFLCNPAKFHYLWTSGGLCLGFLKLELWKSNCIIGKGNRA